MCRGKSVPCVHHRNQTLPHWLPQSRLITQCHCTLFWVGICHMAWWFNHFLVLDKNEAQSFCKELVLLDGSFPNNSCASELGYSMCNLWTRYSNIYKWTNLKSLGLFPDIRVYEVFSNVLRFQLSTSSRQKSQNHQSLWAAVMSDRGPCRGYHQLGEREIWFQSSLNKPICLSTCSSPHLCRWYQVRPLWSWFCLQVPTGA